MRFYTSRTDEKSVFRFLTVVFVAVLAAHCAKEGMESAGDGSEPVPATWLKLLPEQEELDSWRAASPPAVYDEDDLFVYINGGADIYLEYGFEAVLVQEYERAPGESLTLEIFEMSDACSAFGMYTFKTGDEGKELELGNGGFLESYYLNFWKGRHLVTLTGFEETAGCRSEIDRIAKAVAPGIPDSGLTPELVHVLEDEGLAINSIEFFKGHLGLFNCRAFFIKDVFRFDEGVKGDYSDGSRLFVFRYADALECRQRFAAVKNEFNSSDAYKKAQGAAMDGKLAFFDEQGMLILGRTHNDCILIAVMRDGDIHGCESILNKIEKNIDEKLEH